MRLHRLRDFALALFMGATAVASTASAESVPQGMLGAWARDGHCGVAADRLVITATTIKFAEAPAEDAVYYKGDGPGNRDALAWRREGVVSKLELRPPDVIAFWGNGWGMGGPTAFYQRCET